MLANITIEPGRELVQLLIGHPSVAADILETGECVFAATGKGVDPAFEGLGMDLQDGADGIGIEATIEQEDGMQALGDAAIIGLFEATPQILALRTAQGKEFLAHGDSR